MLELFNILLSFLSLTILEIILAIDNVLFISIVTENINIKYQAITRKIGIGLAVFGRVVLLLTISWLTGLHQTLFTIFEFQLSIKDLIMILGGLYLVFYSNQQIFKTLKHKNSETHIYNNSSILKALIIIFLFDSIFSFDSVLTAIAIGHNIYIMITAIIISILVLIISINKISDFILKNPSVKILALSFLILVGFSLFIEGLHYSIPKILLFVIMGFSTFVQIISLKANKNHNDQ
ncbi:TerC family protein [Rickettsiales bacterium LUAb2]